MSDCRKDVVTDKAVYRHGNQGPDIELVQSKPMTYEEFAAYLKASDFGDDDRIKREWDWFTENGTINVYLEDLEW